MSLGYERYIDKVIIIVIIMLLLKIAFVIGSHMPSSAHASHQRLLVLIRYLVSLLFPGLHSSVTGIPVAFVYNLSVSEAASRIFLLNTNI